MRRWRYLWSEIRTVSSTTDRVFFSFFDNKQRNKQRKPEILFDTKSNQIKFKLGLDEKKSVKPSEIQ